MFWVVEYIADQANILIEDHARPKAEWEPVGIGMPHKFAERVAKLHNDAMLELPQNTYEGMQKLCREQPATWYPALLSTMVESAYKKKVFKPGMASDFVRVLEKNAQRHGGVTTPGTPG